MHIFYDMYTYFERIFEYTDLKFNWFPYKYGADFFLPINIVYITLVSYSFLYIIIIIIIILSCW